jgi:hypothetical protein
MPGVPRFGPASDGTTAETQRTFDRVEFARMREMGAAARSDCCNTSRQQSRPRLRESTRPSHCATVIVGPGTWQVYLNFLPEPKHR